MTMAKRKRPKISARTTERDDVFSVRLAPMVARANDNAERERREGHGDLAALLAPYLHQFSFGERLRLAAAVLDQVKRGEPGALERIERARTIIKIVDAQLLDLVRAALK